MFFTPRVPQNYKNPEFICQTMTVIFSIFNTMVTYHDIAERHHSNVLMRDIPKLMDRLIYIPMSMKIQRVLFKKKNKNTLT